MRVLKLKLAAIVLVLSLVALFFVAILTDDDAEASGLNGVVCTTSAGGTAGTVAGFSGEQLQNAAEIVAAGKEMALPQRAWVIAVATAMQESTLHNVDHGDTAGPDSRGLFQQRDSWGPLEVRMNPRGAAKLFYQRLVALPPPGWQGLPLTAAAQQVQRSGLPDAYAKWEQPANQVVGAIEGITCTSGGGGELPPGVNLPDNPQAATVIKAALSQVGVDYAWGGGTADGPSRGIRDGGVADAHGDYNKIGFDCSGLVLYAYAKIGVSVPHQTQAIWNTFQPPITDRAKLQPGDLLLGTGRSASRIHHVGMYLGDGKVVEAPQSGEKVRMRTDIWNPKPGSSVARRRRRGRGRSRQAGAGPRARRPRRLDHGSRIRGRRGFYRGRRGDRCDGDKRDGYRCPDLGEHDRPRAAHRR